MANSTLLDRFHQAHRALSTAYPVVAEFLGYKDRETDFRFLRIVREGDMAWRGVLGVWGDDGTPMVVFASGGDYMDVLHGLCIAFLAGKVYPDRFAPSMGGKGGTAKD